MTIEQLKFKNMKHISLHKFLIGFSVVMLGLLLAEEIRWSLYTLERWGHIPLPDSIKLAAYFLAILPAVISIHLNNRSVASRSFWNKLLFYALQLYLLCAFLGGLFLLILFLALGFHEYRVEGNSFSATLGLSGSITSGLFCYLLWKVGRKKSI